MSVIVVKAEPDLSCMGCGVPGRDMVSLADYSGTFCAECLTLGLRELGWLRTVDDRGDAVEVSR